MSSKLFHPNLQSEAESLAKDLQKSLKVNPQSQKSENPKSIDIEKLTGIFTAVDQDARAQLDKTLTGIELYRAHSYVRDVVDPAPVWQQGSSQLLDYGTGQKRGQGRPVLFVPSLVNRAYILDLMDDCSLLRWLQAQGLRPYLMDWGFPGESEAGLGLDGYICRLIDAFDFIQKNQVEPTGVAGYCMGGLLALALGLHRQDQVSGLALMATPWDFHQPSAGPAKAYSTYIQSLDALLDRQGHLPTDILQSLFTGLDPLLVMHKFSKFATLNQASAKARHFVALEDWLNDGVPLEAQVARDCLIGWYGENSPARGMWQVNGLTIDPALFMKPAIALMPTGDKIVPFASASRLAEALPNTKKLQPPLGHIGMVVGGGAKEMVWQKMASFFKECDI